MAWAQTELLAGHPGAMLDLARDVRDIVGNAPLPVEIRDDVRGARLAAGQVKLLSGGGTLTARPLYGSPVTFRPRYLFLLITNQSHTSKR